MHPAFRQIGRRVLGPRLFGHAQLRLARWRSRGDAPPPETDAVVAATGGAVRNGPFAGLRFPEAMRPEVHMLAAKLLGAYERELHDAVERLVAAAPRRVVNVGAGDGYYAIGLARRLPDAEVIAVDIDERARRVTEAVARANDAGDRVVVRRSCTPGELAPLVGHGTLVVCDCESYEHELLDPAAAPGLRDTAILVELHDHVDPRITPTLRGRFEATHEIEIVATRPPDASRYPELADLDPGAADRLLDEHRPGRMTWAVLVPVKG